MFGIGCVGGSVGRVENSASENTREIIFHGRILMCNDAPVCGGIMELKISVKD